MFDEDVDQLDTQDGDVDGQDIDQTGDDGSGEGAQDEDFLVVSERQRFKTREEAIKSYRNAGTRISELTPYEKIAKQFGVKDPAELIPLLNRAQAAARAEADSAAKKGNEGASDVFSDPNLTPVQKRALQWLKDNAAKVGYVPKSELETLAKQVQDLQKGFETTSQAQKQVQTEATVREGKSHLRSFMSEAKLDPANTKLVKTVENAVAAYIEEDEERLQRFFSGGDEMKALIKEAFDEVAGVFNLVKAKTQAEFTQKKTQVQGRANRPLSRNGNVPVKPEAPKKKGLNADVSNAAWEKFQSLINKNAAAE